MMTTRKIFSKTGLVFLGLFILLTYIGMQINFSPLLGLVAEENQFFTVFQLFGPVAGGFFGAILGAASVLVAELINFILLGKEFEFINLFRLTPMLFAAYYFAKNREKMFKNKFSLIIPAICMIAFILHPIGGQAWYYSLFWLIPIAVKFLPEHLILRSLGATFTAHAIGSTIFLYTIPTTPELWAVILPSIVIFERVIFAIGISISYVAFNTILDKVDSLTLTNLRQIINIEDRYVLSAKNLHF